MNKKEIAHKLIKLISSIRPLKKNLNSNVTAFNFISSGHLNSFEILRLHMLVEKKFKITLDSKDTALKKSNTIEGLASIIFKKIN